MDEILNFKNRAQMMTDCGAILVSHTLRLINVDTQDGLAFRPCDLRVNKFEAVVNADALRNLLYPLRYRFPAQSPGPLPSFKNALAPKRKSGREPTGRNRRALSKRRIIRKQGRRSKQPLSEKAGRAVSGALVKPHR
jgi:hypothetical protein